MRDFTLTVLGSGTCAVTAKRSMASYLVQAGPHALLLDIGAGSIRRMLESGFDPGRIEAILITHFHIDHIADLVPLLWAVRYAPGPGRDQPLAVFGPPGLQDWYAALAAAHGDWLTELPFDLSLTEVESSSWDWHGIACTSMPVYHGVPALGYRIGYEGRSLVYTGDTGYGENVSILAEQADLLVIECSFPDEQGPMDNHLTPASAGRIATESGAKRILLTHLYPASDEIDVVAQCREVYDGEIARAADLQRYTI